MWVDESWYSRHDEKLLCPYCGCSQQDAWELDEDDDTTFCDSCGKEFVFDTCTVTMYSSRAMTRNEQEKANEQRTK